MRIFSLIIVGVALAIAVAVGYREARLGDDSAGPLAAAPRVRVAGQGRTLASVAAEVGRPELFQYDPQTRTATSRATLVVEGELVLGAADRPDSGEVLQFDTQSCGDMRLEVLPAGRLRLYHSTIQTVSQVLSLGACSRGYAFFVDGELVLRDSHVRYISGSTSECLRGPARAEIVRSVFSYCDGSALSCVEVDGARIRIDECDFRGSGNWGVVVQGRGGEPLEIRNSLLDARVGGLMISGLSARVRLIDCVFDPAKLVFNQDSGEVEIAWSRRFIVTDRTSGAPVPGAIVHAEPDAPDGSMSAVETRTDEQGRAEMVLRERMARPGERRDEGTAAGYRISVQTPGGGRQVVEPRLAVRGRDLSPVVLIPS